MKGSGYSPKEDKVSSSIYQNVGRTCMDSESVLDLILSVFGCYGCKCDVEGGSTAFLCLGVEWNTSVFLWGLS